MLKRKKKCSKFFILYNLNGVYILYKRNKTKYFKLNRMDNFRRIMRVAGAFERAHKKSKRYSKRYNIAHLSDLNGRNF